MPKRNHEETEGTQPTILPMTENIRRLMNPADANVFGTVHGGHILSLLCDAGQVMATKYCNQPQGTDGNPAKSPSDNQYALATLARVERADFVSPMFVGEVADVNATVVYTSPHSLEVTIDVHGEDAIKGSRRLTNRARLWYVPVVYGDRKGRVLPVPAMVNTSIKDQERGRLEYEACVKARKNKNNASEEVPQITNNDYVQGTGNIATCMPHSVGFSHTHVTHLVNPEDLTANGNCRGGVILKLMDECAGVVAAKHCRTKVATVRFDAVNFRHRITKGCMLTASGRATFTSMRSLEIEVVVNMESVWQEEHRKCLAVDGLITFVSLDENNKPLPMPQLKVLNDAEVSRSVAGQMRYKKFKNATGDTAVNRTNSASR